ncbi:MAG: hypothetical protein ABR923_05595 [Terracidiphilus sp.]|jgi:hypothetical protein
MDSQDEVEVSQFDPLAQVFREQLMACLEECAQGRRGLFSDYEALSDGEEDAAWPEAARLRELALALQGIFAQREEPNALCDEFLDLCSIHGESHPGERRLARMFLERIEKGEVGTKPAEEFRRW